MTAARRLCGAHESGGVVDPGTRYEDDPAAQMIASRGGSTLELVAEALGVSRERVRQIQADALRKLRAKPGGLTAEDIGEILATRRGVHEDGGSDSPIGERTERSAIVAQKRASGEWSRGHGGYVPVERLPEGAWSEHGQRVEAALAAAEVAVARAELASLRGRGAEL